MEDHNAVSRLPLGDAYAYSPPACDFVPEDAGAECEPVAIFFKISAADAAGVDANQHLAFADFRHWHGLQADVVHSAIDQRQHGGGDRLNLIFDGAFWLRP